MQTHYSRHWLNPPGGGNAFIQTEIELPESDRKQNWIEAYVSIADCSRNIQLDFCTYTDSRHDSPPAKLAKLDLLIKTLTEFRAAYVAAIARTDTE